MIEVEIKQDYKDFLKDLYAIQVDIQDLFYKISLGKDYNDESTKRLYIMYKLMKGIDINQ